MTRRRTPGRRPSARRESDPAHAPGKHKKAPPPDAEPNPRRANAPPGHDQPWVPTSGLIGRKRRSARRS